MRDLVGKMAKVQESPPGITVNAVYEPDMEKMVKALKIVLESPDPKKILDDKRQKEGA